MEIEIGIAFKQRLIIATLRWGREEKWKVKRKRRGEVEVSVSSDRDKPNALLTLEHFLLLLPLESSPGGASSSSSSSSGTLWCINFLPCLLCVSFLSPGQVRMHPSRMKSCCQPASKARQTVNCVTVSANCLPTSICVCWPLAMRQQESVL